MKNNKLTFIEHNGEQSIVFGEVEKGKYDTQIEVYSSEEEIELYNSMSIDEVKKKIKEVLNGTDVGYIDLPTEEELQLLTQYSVEEIYEIIRNQGNN